MHCQSLSSGESVFYTPRKHLHGTTMHLHTRAALSLCHSMDTWQHSLAGQGQAHDLKAISGQLITDWKGGGATCCQGVIDASTVHAGTGFLPHLHLPALMPLQTDKGRVHGTLHLG